MHLLASSGRLFHSSIQCWQIAIIPICQEQQNMPVISTAARLNLQHLYYGITKNRIPVPAHVLLICYNRLALTNLFYI